MFKPFLGCLTLLTILQGVMSLTFDFGKAELEVILDMQKNFFANSTHKGFVTIDNEPVKVLPDEFFVFLEGPLRFEFEFNDVDANSSADEISLKVKAIINKYFENVHARDASPDDPQIVDEFSVLAGILQGLNKTEAANFEVNNAATANDIKLVGPSGIELGVSIENVTGEDELVAIDNQTTISLGPNVFCLVSKQCKGNREVTKYKDKAERRCNRGSINKCDSFVAFFTLRWLLGWILVIYGIIVLWALYWIYPWFKRKSKSKSHNSSDGPYSDQDQIIINSVAAQCVSAENLLFMAGDMKMQAISMENMDDAESKKESKILIYTVEYFEACCAIMVSLTHGYLSRKTSTEEANWSMEDATTRALQIEVLNFVKERLQLALKSEAMTEKSLFRISEAYAILKKILDSIVLVGVSYDRMIEEGLGDLKTPFVRLTEDAIFLGGICNKSMLLPEAEEYNDLPVCVAMEEANKREIPSLSSTLFLEHQWKDSKIYDPQSMSVKPGIGKSFGMSSLKSAQNGEGFQSFVNAFWTNEIIDSQEEAVRWLNIDGALDEFLEKERLDREDKASPMVEAIEKTKRIKGNKASGWQIRDENNFVFNINAVVTQGLGIAGKHGLPYDHPGDTPIKKFNKIYEAFEYYFPNYAEWPKFYTLVFVIIPLIISIPMLLKIGKGAGAVDIDGNVHFKARVVGFGTSYIGVPAYYFLDGFVPETDDLVPDPNNNLEFPLIARELENKDPFGNGGGIFISNQDAANMFENDFDGASGRKPEDFITEIQASILAQPDSTELEKIRNQQKAQEATTLVVYALMHNAGYFFSLIPLTLVRESLEILARRFPSFRNMYPISLWKELHMSIGLAAIFCVILGATIFLVTSLTAIGRSTPFAGLAGDPNIGSFFDASTNVLYVRQLLLPLLPLLLLMKYASRGPPKWMLKYAPTIISFNYWEICYFVHYFTSLTAIILLMIYRSQLFFWMGITWGFIWGGNKIVRVLRTTRAICKYSNLISCTTEDHRTNERMRVDVVTITLDVPSVLRFTSRGQICWVTCPSVDYIAHPFILTKVPTENDLTIMFHITVKCLNRADVVTPPRPDEPPPTSRLPVHPYNVPRNWRSYDDRRSGDTYYANTITGKTTWNPPQGKLRNSVLRAPQVVRETLGSNEPRLWSYLSKRPSWTQRFSDMNFRLQSMDEELRMYAKRSFPIYVSAPLGCSMDHCLLPSLPGSVIITTQIGFAAGECSVQWLMKQDKSSRPKFHFFVSIFREPKDALPVLQTLMNGMCESVAAGNLDIEGLHEINSHMVDGLGFYIYLTTRDGNQINGDRLMLMRCLNPPREKLNEKQLYLIESFLKSRLLPGRLAVDRFLARTQQMVKKRCGVDNMVVGFCGSSAVGHKVRSACKRLERVDFKGEFI